MYNKDIKKSINLLIDIQIYEKIKSIAAKNQRSVNNQINKALQEWLTIKTET